MVQRCQRCAARVRERHVVVRAHLGETAHGAREFLGVRALDVQRLGGGGGRQHELHAMIVQDVDEPGEPARAHRRAAGPSAGRRRRASRRSAARARGSRAASAALRTAPSKSNQIGAARTPPRDAVGGPRSTSFGGSSGPLRHRVERARHRRLGRGIGGHVEHVSPARACATGSRCRRRPRRRRATRRRSSIVGRKFSRLQPVRVQRRPADSSTSSRTRRRARTARRAAGPRIIASAMSETWNSSKQISR